MQQFTKISRIFRWKKVSNCLQNLLILSIKNCYTYSHLITYQKKHKKTYFSDDTVASDSKYLKTRSFLYERFKDSNKLSKEEKDLIVSRIYSCMYYDGAKKIRNTMAEKGGFLLHHFLRSYQ